MSHAKRSVPGTVPMKPNFDERKPSPVVTTSTGKRVSYLQNDRDGRLKKAYKEWTLVGALTASGLPTAIYALQNSLLQISYKNLDSLTFSMLNQTKIIFIAICTYLILSPLCVNGLPRLAKRLCFCALKELFHGVVEVKKHWSYLMTVEMSIVGSFCLLVSTTKSLEGEAIRKHGLFYGWILLTWVMN
uniref:UDP-N-acetylglucosamine transporter n=1 Tax=Rosa rugosa TaxID=74645 RepID=J7G5C3_ROSRU|nr:UDP-N-acetylglucosamine transporter [Rosa rugosa]